MTVFKRNVHLGTKDPLIETDDIADKAVTTEKIDDKAVAMSKIGDDVKQYIATQVGTETTDREGEIERLEGLIDLERSDRDTEEGAIWADVRKKANIVDISDYMSENAHLPLNGAYNYEGVPVTAVPANIDTASVIEGVSPGDSDIETFILFRVEADVSYKPAHLFYVCFWENGRYANRWFANDAPEDVKRVFNDNIVASDVAGLMSATDKNNLDTAVSDLSVVKGKIAPAASSTNQLADKDFVNSSIATNTATFRGTVDSVSALDNIVGADENDYAFVARTDESGNLWYDRYKRTGNSWLFEYTLNNSSFTAEQWAAINSGLNSNDRGNVDTAVRNASTAVGTANTALGQSDTALLRSGEAVGIARNDAHIVANLEGAFSGTSPILDFSTDTEYGTGANQVNYCYKDGLLYRAVTTHEGEWNAEHFEAINMIDLLETYENMVVGDKTVNGFDTEKEYTAGDPVIYNNEFYIFKRGHTGEWDETDVDKTSFIEWLKNLSDTIETYVGNGKEQVVVSCSTEAQGVSMAGLTLMVYLNGSTTEAEEYTTDSHGMATFRIPVGYTYRIVYPSVAGVVTPAPVTHTASIGQRSVEAVYNEPPAVQTEKLSITFKQWSQSSGYAVYQGQVKITYGGTTTTYTADTGGTVMVEIPIGTAYTIEYVKPEDMHIHGNVYKKSLVAERTFRYEVAIFSEFLTGVFITDSAGNDYTLEYFQSLVESGTMAREDAKFFHVCTNTLFTKGVVSGSDCCFYVSVYEISKRKYHDTDGNFANMQWCSNNVRFTTIPDNVYQYDGKYRTAQIVAEGIDRGDATPAATRLSGMSYTLTDENNTTISGFLGSRGQWDALWNNRSYIDEMLDYLYDGAEHLTLSSFTTNKWASDQNGNSAYCLYIVWYISIKNSQCMAVPFYA